ncbi:MAG TPA: transglycosylase family protein [Solirubrobacteraceae bacterium]|nr:transglycosylase family protein [Solirubrobacteraceae bacterium]
MPLKFPRHSPHAVRRPVTLGAAGLAAVTASAGLLATAPAASATPQIIGLLAVGAKGAQVRELQHALHLKRTGHFTAATRRSVVRFQVRKRLEVDGVVGPQTWDTLFHIAAPAPVPAPTPVTSAPASTTAPGYASSGYSIPSSIVQCESGGNWSAVNPSSGAGGAYQILPSTWAAYGGTGSPQDASPAEQSAIAARIYATQGPSAWTC